MAQMPLSTQFKSLPGTLRTPKNVEPLLHWTRVEYTATCPTIREKIQAHGLEGGSINDHAKLPGIIRVVSELVTEPKHHELFNRALQNGVDADSVDSAVRGLIYFNHRALKRRATKSNFEWSGVDEDSDDAYHNELPVNQPISQSGRQTRSATGRLPPPRIAPAIVHPQTDESYERLDPVDATTEDPANLHLQEAQNGHENANPDFQEANHITHEDAANSQDVEILSAKIVSRSELAAMQAQGVSVWIQNTAPSHASGSALPGSSAPAEMRHCNSCQCHRNHHDGLEQSSMHPSGQHNNSRRLTGVKFTFESGETEEVKFLIDSY